jgi:hypothetical protein
MKQILFLLTILTLALTACTTPNPSADLDAFAKCLGEKGVTMYGAEWCSHCKDQKKMFGDSWKFVPYVECPDNPNECLAKDIKNYPTWIFQGPLGKKMEGAQSLETLAKESSCPLIEKTL